MSCGGAEGDANKITEEPAGVLAGASAQVTRARWVITRDVGTQ